jgi:hypothetical protein
LAFELPGSNTLPDELDMIKFNALGDEGRKAPAILPCELRRKGSDSLLI